MRLRNAHTQREPERREGGGGIENEEERQTVSCSADKQGISDVSCLALEADLTGSRTGLLS